MIDCRQRWEQCGNDQCGHYATNHAGEKAITIESPPVPFENVGRHVARVQQYCDPLRDTVDGLDSHAG